MSAAPNLNTLDAHLQFDLARPLPFTAHPNLRHLRVGLSNPGSLGAINLRARFPSLETVRFADSQHEALAKGAGLLLEMLMGQLDRDHTRFNI